MKHTAHKLLALLLALAMLVSIFAVAEDGTQAIAGTDGPIELSGEAIDAIQDPADGLEIATDEGDGITDGGLELEDGSDLDMNLDLGGDLELDLDLEGEALETLEGELAPVTEEAMNDGGLPPITSWSDLQTALDGPVPEGESKDNPSCYELDGVIEADSTDGGIIVAKGRYVVLDLKRLNRA